MILIGAAGLGTEAASWYSTKRALQNAADLGAMSAATALLGGASDNDAKSNAKAAVGVQGFNPPSGSTTVNVPPLSGTHTGSTYAHAAVEVTVSQPAPLLFSGLFLTTAPTIGARAVGIVGGTPPSCILATNTTAYSGAIMLQGNPTLSLSCGIAANSSASDAFSLGGSASLTTTAVIVKGDISGQSKITSPIFNKGVVTADPYASLAIPSFSGCNSTGISGKTTTPIDATGYGGKYVICGDVTAKNGTVTLSNGIFFVDRGNLSVQANGNLITNNATIILTSSTGTGIGSFSSVANSSVSLGAMSTGPTSGLAIIQDRRATVGNLNSYHGTPATDTSGALYFPSGALDFYGNASVSSTGCTQIIANTLTFHGNPNLFINGCTGVGTTPIGGNVAQLVE
jgi:hypothetical protein